MESIPEINDIDSQELLDDDSEYLIQKLEKDKRKKEQLMAQRLRGRLAKTARLRKSSDTDYGIAQSSSSDDDDDLTSYWNQIKDKSPTEIRAASSNLFKRKSNGGRTRKLRKSRRTRKLRKSKKVNKSKRIRK